MKRTVESPVDKVHVQRLGERIIISCDDESALNNTIKRLSQDSKVVSIASWRETTCITAIVTLRHQSGKQEASLARVQKSKIA